MAWNPWTHQARVARPEHCGRQTGTRNADDRVASDARRDGARDLSRWRAPPIATTSRDQYLFTTKCSACRTIGRGDRIGPDLGGISRVRERDGWLAISRRRM